MKKQKDKLSAQYKREVEERIFEWKEAKEEVLEAIFEKEKQKLEDEHEARQLELEKELQTRRSKLQLFLKEDEEKWLYMIDQANLSWIQEWFAYLVNMKESSRHLTIFLAMSVSRARHSWKPTRFVLRRFNIHKQRADPHELPMSEQDTFSPPSTTDSRLESKLPEGNEESSLLDLKTDGKKTKKISTGELIMLTFFWTTGGPFGIERYEHEDLRQPFNSRVF